MWTLRARPGTRRPAARPALARSPLQSGPPRRAAPDQAPGATSTAHAYRAAPDQAPGATSAAHWLLREEPPGPAQATMGSYPAVFIPGCLDSRRSAAEGRGVQFGGNV